MLPPVMAGKVLFAKNDVTAMLTFDLWDHHFIRLDFSVKLGPNQQVILSYSQKYVL